MTIRSFYKRAGRLLDRLYYSWLLIFATGKRFLRAAREPPHRIRSCMASLGLAFPAKVAVFRSNQLLKLKNNIYH